MYLRDRSWRISYSSNENNPIADFYIPALECAVNYDRKSGFFGSAILSKVARGIGAMLHNQGKMRLIMGCQFSSQDIAAIEKGYELREALAFRLEADLQAPANFVQLKHFEILSWLIQNQYLDIKIAVPIISKQDARTTDKAIPIESDRLLDPQHIFHEKVGIFTDSKGDRIAFSGSNNESLGGWSNNVESFHVYCGWEGDRDLERVNEEAYRFEQLWNDLSPNIKIFDIPEAVKQKLLRYTPNTKPIWNREDETKNEKYRNAGILPARNSYARDLRNRDLAAINSEAKNTKASQKNTEEASKMLALLANLHQHPGCLDFCLKSIPIQPWAHQLKILRRVADKFPCSFLIADEVGLGKTIETGLILRYLIVSQKVKRVLVLAPASVQPQWQEELREKFNLHFSSYSQGKFKDCYGKITYPALNPWNTKNLVLASSHLVRRAERMTELLDAEPWDLVIVDEAHHARRKSPQQRKDTPNRLLQLLQQLKDKTQSLILLSATPMQIDPIEVFDLLNLLGLEGHWSFGENFCDYFSSLSSKPDDRTLEFWQYMATDYFRYGGQECDRLKQHLSKNNQRLLAGRLQNIWQDGRSIVNGKKLAKDTEFIDLSRQYLTVNTPLKDLMFRHTRDTLRQYYKLGLLDKDIPQRIVIDNAIALESQREIPLYQAVSNYVRHFYNLAQKENRKALGFLMTLYRKRLTSSFYAIQQSLQRRLEGIQELPQDDLSDLDDADDAVITGLESYLREPVDPKEIEHLEDLLRQFENTGEDSKLSHFLTILGKEIGQRESAIVFTQYTDTMDYLRENLLQLYGSLVACYSGRGGELYQEGEWKKLPKEEIKQQFRDGKIKILLCTESASEGLNLQTCGVLINYDLPWNPMRVEQRIGRIDRIGQVHSTVNIHNFYYDGTVEAKVYRRLRDRIDAFQSVVGNLQPILAQVPTFIEQAVMSADPEEEGVLLAEFEQVLDTPPLRPGLEEMVSQCVVEVPSIEATGEPVRVAMDVQADLKEIRKPLASSPITSEQIEALFTNSQILPAQNIFFELKGDKPNGIASQRIWELTYKDITHLVTFYPEIFDEKPSLRLMSLGEPIFQKLLETIITEQNQSCSTHKQYTYAPK